MRKLSRQSKIICFRPDNIPLYLLSANPVVSKRQAGFAMDWFPRQKVHRND